MTQRQEQMKALQDLTDTDWTEIRELEKLIYLTGAVEDDFQRPVYAFVEWLLRTGTLIYHDIPGTDAPEGQDDEDPFPKKPKKIVH